MIAMFIILKILLIALCILISILILILFIPFGYFLTGKINDNVEGNIEIKWMFGLIRIVICKGKNNPEIGLSICRLNIYNKKLIKKTNSKKEKNLKKRFKSRNIGKELLIELYNYCKDILCLIKPKHFKINGVYGFDDPSVTGMILGAVNMINGTIPNAEININPVFDEKIINIEAKTCGDIKIYLICYRTLKLLMKRNVRQSLFKKSKSVETF